MRKILLVIALVIILIATISITSAEIIINSQPKENYNLGETITVPITVKSLTKYTGVIELNLICSGKEINFYKNGVALSEGEEKRMQPSLILTKDIINKSKGSCTIKAILGTDYILTNNFRISDTITISASTDLITIDPGQTITLEGSATKPSITSVNGFVQIDVYPENFNKNTTPMITKIETINNGFFLADLTTATTAPSGKYTIILNAYEKDLSGDTTNQGEQKLSFSINQIPTNIEIITVEPKISPGNPLKARAILHDQTGNNIPETIKIEIKDNKNKLLDKFEVKTDEEFVFATKYNQEPGTYMILAKTLNLENTARFSIIEKKDIKLQIVNDTLFVKNTGNVAYCNKSVLVRIGSQALNIDPCIEVDTEEKYKLSAPDGKYEVEIITDEGEFRESAILTGKTIEISKTSEGVFTLARYPLVWIFVIAIMGFVVFNIYKKGFRKTFIGYAHKKKPKTPKTTQVKIKEKAPAIKKIFNVNLAELCLSIKGDKQNATVIGLNLKNYKEIIRNPEGVLDTIGKITNLIKESKASIYENEENIFIILAPTRTRTFKNEKPALHLAQKIKNTLSKHNRLMKQKIEYGIAINTGTIIARQLGETLQFMSLGDLMTASKKIAAISKETILLGEKIKENLGSDIKVEKFKKDKVVAFAIKEIKDRSESEKFIKSFLDRVEKK